MDKRQFSEQIAEAIKQLGAEAEAGCIARSPICLAHAAENDLEFTREQGQVSIERQVISDTAKHCSMKRAYSSLGVEFGFFVTSCGFGLIEQVAHWAANQVDHVDEVGLVPVSPCA